MKKPMNDKSSSTLSMRIREPNPLIGALDSRALEGYLLGMQKYFVGAEFPESKQVRCPTMYFEGYVIAWW